MDFQTFDSAYVERVRAGDQQAERHFVGYFGELILLKLRSRLHSKQAIEDVRQETFVRAFALLRSDGGVRNPESLGAVVNSICNHVLLEHYRRDSRSKPIEESDVERFVHPGPDALSLTISADTRRMVREVLQELTERDRCLLVAIFLEERDRDEVCKEMQVNREYVRVLVHRAKGAFREIYARRVGLQRHG